jgi:hypothetical protein
VPDPLLDHACLQWLVLAGHPPAAPGARHRGGTETRSASAASTLALIRGHHPPVRGAQVIVPRTPPWQVAPWWTRATGSAPPAPTGGVSRLLSTPGSRRTPAAAPAPTADRRAVWGCAGRNACGHPQVE